MLQRSRGMNWKMAHLSFYAFAGREMKNKSSARFGSTCTEIGTIQRRLAWPLCKDDTQICEAFHIFKIWGKKKKNKVKTYQVLYQWNKTKKKITEQSYIMGSFLKIPSVYCVKSLYLMANLETASPSKNNACLVPPWDCRAAATTSVLHRAGMRLRRLCLGCESGLLNSVLCAQVLLKDCGHRSPPSNHSSHTYPGILGFQYQQEKF